jgi:hypothetical protein
MRHGLVLTGVLIAVALGTASGAGAAVLAPGSVWSKAAVGYWDRQYWRYGPYGVPPCRGLVPPVVVPQPAPVPPMVVKQPVIVLPPRPAGCGEYR